MPKIADATFKSQQNTFNFEVYPLPTIFNAVGAVYIFTKRTVDASGRGSHTLLYIGETGSLANRIPKHEKLDCVARYGANCICVLVNNNEEQRRAIETELRAANATPCNDQ